MKYWTIDIHCERGPRNENQDNFLLVDTDGEYLHLLNEKHSRGKQTTWPTDHLRLAVVDGMGGHDLGREFAESVITGLLDIPFQTNPMSLKIAIEQLHEKLFDQFFQNKRSPGSTLVMADISPKGHAIIANVGDSRAYLSTPPEPPTLLTHDHTEAELAWRTGLITTEELELLQSERKPNLAQAMGFGHILLATSESNELPPRKQHNDSLSLTLEGEHPDVFSLKIKEGQTLRLASDGWWDKDSADNSTMLELTRLPLPSDDKTQ